ncbi:MAG: hypothetical protein AAGJ79_15590 [Verrucomicrobiota bacterium]
MFSPDHPIHYSPFLALLVGLLLTSCVSSRTKKGEESLPVEQTAPTVKTDNRTNYLVGKITFIHPERPFVLIRVGMLPKMNPGEIWEFQRGSAPAGQLNPSGERKGNTVAADILNGDPRVGDFVVYRGETRTAPPAEKKGLFSKFSDRRDAKKRSKALRKSAAERRKLEAANSWNRVNR